MEVRRQFRIGIQNQIVRNQRHLQKKEYVDVTTGESSGDAQEDEAGRLRQVRGSLISCCWGERRLHNMPPEANSIDLR